MRYHNITHDNMTNGDGVRVVLWLSGCEHHCDECQNPITWNPNDGLEFDKAAMEEVESELAKDYVSGITFSGGDPLHPANREEVDALIEFIKGYYDNKTVWIYTGYTWEEIFANDDLLKVIRGADVLVDGKFNKDLLDKNYHWAGSTNQRVIDIQKSIAQGKVILHESN